MGRIPVQFHRVAAAFDSEVARVRLCGSSGSEHSPESSTDLSDLVKSFMEKNEGSSTEREVEEAAKVVVHHYDKDRNEWSDSEKMEMLQQIFSDDDGIQIIRRELTELALELVGDKPSSPSAGFKRLFMSRLRERGFDAGLCKSKWEKNKRFPGGDYEYIDLNFEGNRYIVEVFLDAEFEIARPTNQYSSLLDVFPLVFVGKVEELKQVLRLMCSAIKDSMKSMDMHIPPWRRNSYMQAKWFSSYKRTINDISTRSKASSSPFSPQVFSTTKSIGFVARPVKSYHNCKDDYGSKAAFRVGYLTTAFNVDSLGM